MDKITLIRGVAEGRYTARDAAKRLGLGERRVLQLRKIFVERGEDSLVHGNSGRSPANRKDDEFREKIIVLKNTPPYKNSNITQFWEMLVEREGIRISYSTLSAILKSAGIESGRSHREGKRFRWRKRRKSFGEMLEIVAARHDWLGNGNPCMLYGVFDDATGRITGMHFCKGECMMGYLEVLRQTLSTYGFPLELYSEKTGLFFGASEKGRYLAGDKTMLGHIVEDLLGIGITDENTIPSKGCIERLCVVLRDRLADWFKTRGVTDIDHANRELGHCVSLYNKNFIVKPRKTKSHFEPLNASFDMNRFLSVRYEISTDDDGRFSFKGFVFRVDSPEPVAKKKIWFLFGREIGFLALHGRGHYPVLLLGSENDEPAVDVLDALVRESYYGELGGRPP